MTTGNTSRREFLRATGATGLALTLGDLMGGCARSSRLPNVVLVFTDDQG